MILHRTVRHGRHLHGDVVIGIPRDRLGAGIAPTDFRFADPDGDLIHKIGNILVGIRITRRDRIGSRVAARLKVFRKFLMRIGQRYAFRRALVLGFIYDAFARSDAAHIRHDDGKRIAVALSAIRDLAFWIQLGLVRPVACLRKHGYLRQLFDALVIVCGFDDGIELINARNLTRSLLVKKFVQRLGNDRVAACRAQFVFSRILAEFRRGIGGEAAFRKALVVRAHRVVRRASRIPIVFGFFNGHGSRAAEIEIIGIGRGDRNYVSDCMRAHRFIF